MITQHVNTWRPLFLLLGSILVSCVALRVQPLHDDEFGCFGRAQLDDLAVCIRVRLVEAQMDDVIDLVSVAILPIGNRLELGGSLPFIAWFRRRLFNVLDLVRLLVW